MGMLFDITKSFLIDGIKVLIQQSIDADNSKLDEWRIFITKQGRDKIVSDEKRKILEALIANINELKPSNDDEAFANLELKLRIAIKDLKRLCVEHAVPEWSTESGLEKLHTEFLDKVNKKFLNPFIVKSRNPEMAIRDKIVHLTGKNKVETSDEEQLAAKEDVTLKDDPLDILLFHLLQYQITILYKDHNAYVKHAYGVIVKKLQMIEQQIHLYYEGLQDLNPAHSELMKAKSKQLLIHIELMQYKAKEIELNYKVREFFSANTQINDYLTEASMEIGLQWMIDSDKKLAEDPDESVLWSPGEFLASPK